MAPVGYRLQMSIFARLVRVTINLVLVAFFLPVLVDPDQAAHVRLGSVLGVVLAAYGLRVVLGPAVVVRPEGLRIFTWWPRHRDIAWYRVYAVDIVPGRWLLEVELNAGDRLTLPVVERVDDLYERIEDLRQRLDA
jgi:hypothetical protein